MNVGPWEKGYAELQAAATRLRRAVYHLNPDVSGMNEEILLLLGRVEDLAKKAKEVSDFKTHQIRLHEIQQKEVNE